jgi:hypothetical protein
MVTIDTATIDTLRNIAGSGGTGTIIDTITIAIMIAIDAYVGDLFDSLLWVGK